jgi:hypothetical protein
MEYKHQFVSTGMEFFQILQLINHVHFKVARIHMVQSWVGHYRVHRFNRYYSH